MTIKEYLAQADPVRFPAVLLTANEVTFLCTYQYGENTKSLYYIKGIEGEYVSTNRSRRLYTTDQDGNAKSPSCFILPEKLDNFNTRDLMCELEF